jgi:hypothetical protein
MDRVSVSRRVPGYGRDRGGGTGGEPLAGGTRTPVAGVAAGTVTPPVSGEPARAAAGCVTAWGAAMTPPGEPPIGAAAVGVPVGPLGAPGRSKCMESPTIVSVAE